MDRDSAKDLVEEMLDVHDREVSSTFETLCEYRKGTQPFPGHLAGVPPEVVRFVRSSRINVVGLAVEVMSQSLAVGGYRDSAGEPELEAWRVWQANRMDARHKALHRGALTYGVSYAMVLPGEPAPVISTHSPMRAIGFYGSSDEWPDAFLYRQTVGDFEHLNLVEPERIWTFTTEGGLEYIEDAPHSVGYVPVIRYRNYWDIDEEENPSEVDQLATIQDQIDLTTFDLLVAQHYQSFRQRYVIGWLGENDLERARASASRLWTFDDPDVKVGEFAQVDLSGLLNSRESSLEAMAMIGQVPPHHLLGKMINLSAEALAAAESGHRRKMEDRKDSLGESHEQTLRVCAQLAGFEPDLEAEIRWRDTEARSLAQTVDALGKIATMLGVPPEVLWERIPDVTPKDLAAWRRAAAEADSIGALASILDRQSRSNLGFGQPAEPAL